MGSEFQAADLFVNLSETGSSDQAILEAMSCEGPAVTSNVAFRHTALIAYPELLLDGGIAGDLAHSIKAISHWQVKERIMVGKVLRADVKANHDLDRLSKRLVNHVL